MVRAVLALALLACSASSWSQAFPSKPVKIVVPYGVGGSADVYARYLGAKLQESVGQTFVIENRPGGGSIVGTDVVAKSEPDGYTLLMMSNTHTVNETLIPKKPFDLMRDFAPITLMASAPFILSVNPSVRANSVAELIALAKAKPKTLHYGTGGAGSPPHLSAELLRAKTGIDVVHVPYKGIVPAITAQVAGEIQLTFAVVPAVLPMLKSGKVRALGVTSAQRTPLAPDLPTIAETVPGYEFIGWYTLVAPARTPGATLSRPAPSTTSG